MRPAKKILMFRKFTDKEKRWFTVPCADQGSLMKTE